MVSSAFPDPRPAASLILLRDGAGLEVLVGRRPENIAAFPGATAFPGGKIEPQDYAWPGVDGDLARAAAFAALRETFEETGLVLAADGAGAPPSADVAALCREVEAGRLGFPEVLAGWDVRLDPGRLTPFSRFVTPESYPYRFDTWFFLAVASPAEATAALVCGEFEALSWASPAHLLDDPDIRLPRPTRGNLQRLGASRTSAEAQEMARSSGLYTPLPP